MGNAQTTARPVRDKKKDPPNLALKSGPTTATYMTDSTCSPTLESPADQSSRIIGGASQPANDEERERPVHHIDIERAEDEEEEETIGGGTLRSAMQGRADHVVYGPPRLTPSLTVPTSSNSVTGPPVAFTGGISERRAKAMEIPISMGNTYRIKPEFGDVSISVPSSHFNSLAPVTIASEDTDNPLYRNAPRLTSEVVQSPGTMPILTSPISEDLPIDSPFGPDSVVTSISSDFQNLRIGGSNQVLGGSSGMGSLTEAARVIREDTGDNDGMEQPVDTIVAPVAVGATETDKPSTPTTSTPKPLLLPSALLNYPSAAIPIPFSVLGSPDAVESVKRAAVDLTNEESTSGVSPSDAQPSGPTVEEVPTLIKWRWWEEEDNSTGNKTPTDESSRILQHSKGPNEVYVTGTFANGWKTRIELRKNSLGDFTALVNLAPGAHRLKFIVDDNWKASKFLQLATDADGNLINYLYIPKSGGAEVGTQQGILDIAPVVAGTVLEEEEDIEVGDGQWTTEIPTDLVQWGDWEILREELEIEIEERDARIANGETVDRINRELPPQPTALLNVPPPTLPAQLEKGPLNHSAYVSRGSGDDNSILPKPDHSVINHLAASPIKGGFLSVGVTTRYRRKFVTIVYYKALS